MGCRSKSRMKWERTRLPATCLPSAIASPNLLAHVMCRRFADGVPYYRQEKQLARLGLEISRATMCNWTSHLGNSVAPLWEMLLEEAKTRKWLGVDETTFQVLRESGRDNRAMSYVWVIRAGPPGNPIILYKYAPSRAGAIAADLLRGYRGIVQTDGYSGYSFLSGWEGVRHAGCWDHARRHFAEAVRVRGKYRKTSKLTYADQALRKIGKIYSVEREADKKCLTPEARRNLRQTVVKPHLEEFHKWLVDLYAMTPPKGLLGKAISYTLKQWPKLLVYLDCGELKPANILVENAIRPFVIGRKNFLFSGHPDGAQAGMYRYTLVETAKANGWEPFAYLHYLFEQLPKANTIEEQRRLLPTNPPVVGE